MPVGWSLLQNEVFEGDPERCTLQFFVFFLTFVGNEQQRKKLKHLLPKKLEWVLAGLFLESNVEMLKTMWRKALVKAVVKRKNPRTPAFQPFMKPVSYFLQK